MLGLQTIVSRQADLTTAPAVITLGVVQAGNRSNIIPELATLEGTIRTFDPNVTVTTTSEDFALFLQRAPGFMFFLGIAPKGADPAAFEPNHSPRFFVDESALVTGVRALASLAADYLAGIK